MQVTTVVIIVGRNEQWLGETDGGIWGIDNVL